MKRIPFCAALILFSIGPVAAQTLGESPWLIPPVDGSISRHFDEPDSDYGAGHRGVDYEVPSGTAVRAAADGTVIFSGQVAGAHAVTLAHAGDMKTTYSMLSAVQVDEGQTVGRGAWIGRTGSSHPGTYGGLHFAVKVHARYVDPIDYLGALDVTQAIHLAPIPDDATVSGRLLADFEAASPGFMPCRTARNAQAIPRIPPNENIVVVVAGISSKTKGGSNSRIFEVPAALGYPSDRVYRFSYAGLAGPRWHEPYVAADTNTDLVRHAERLAGLLKMIAEQHPGADIDVIAHSQGGIIARAYLEGMAGSWAAGAPRIDHLITLATPHRGSELAHVADDLRRESVTGRLVAEAASFWATHGGPVPDPDSPAAQQLKTNSSLIRWLASEDVAYGTRVMALASPYDLIATAHRAVMPGELSRIVPPEDESPGDAPEPKSTGLLGDIPIGGLEAALDAGRDVIRALGAHTRIVDSPYARRLAYAFLGDHPEPCRTGWDAWGPDRGRFIGGLERSIGAVLGGAESLVTRFGLP